MFRNLFTLLVVGALGYWYYTGPFHDQANPSQASQLKDNAKKMELCLRAEAYARGTTGEGSRVGLEVRTVGATDLVQ